MDWVTIELMGYTYFSSRGYRILVPLVKNDDYDFIVEKEGKFLRINVKTAYLRDKSLPNSWSICMSSGAPGERFQDKKKRKSGTIDIYLAWIPPLNDFIELPGNFLNDVNSKARRVPVNLYKDKLRGG